MFDQIIEHLKTLLPGIPVEMAGDTDIIAGEIREDDLAPMAILTPFHRRESGVKDESNPVTFEFIVLDPNDQSNDEPVAESSTESNDPAEIAQEAALFFYHNYINAKKES